MRASNEASTSTDLTNTSFRSRPEAVLDLISAVKGLHKLSPQQLGKLMRDSGNSVVRHIAEDGSNIQVDLEKFARYLPLHLMAVIMAWERDRSTFKYLLCGILLLHAMCDLASQVPKIEQVLLDDVKVSEQLIDLVFYLLVLLAAYRRENNAIPNDMVLLHSALVACGLKLLTVIVSSQYQEVAQVLTAYYKVDMFMDTAFAAVCMDVKFLQTRLSAERDESSASISPTTEETMSHLCQQCDSSLQFLLSLCQQKLFRECLVKNKELCGNGGVLVLVQAVMNLNISPSYSSSLYMASVSRLKSKALSIILCLCKAESVSYLDEVASNPGSQELAKSIALEVLELLKKMFGIDSKQLNASSEVIYPKGQLELNAMRLTDVFSDDSNFRSFIMINFREALAAIFLLPHGEFLSSWCSSDLPVCEDDATLDVPRASYAYQRTSLLIKVIANLHCFVPDVCQDEKDLFLNKFVGFVQKESQKLSDGFLSTLDADKTTSVSKNLCSLLSHAESLIPRFLNEDDVQLLRLFISQFESQMVPAASEDHQVQDAQNRGVHSSPLHREVAPDHGNNDINMEEGMRDIASLEVDQLDVSRTGNDQSIDEQKKSGMMEQDKSNGASINSKENERDFRAVETSGSDSSHTRGKNLSDRMDIDHIIRIGFEETMEEEKSDAMHSDEKQQRKRKRPIMNDKHIALIESALVDEPDMHRNATSLRLWADKLSLHGAEVTTSRLKNWLNNRKARLARAAKDTRVFYEGDGLGRQGGFGHLDSPRSPMDDPHILLSAKGSIGDEVTVTDTAVTVAGDEDLGTSSTDIVRSGPHFEPEKSVRVEGMKGEEVGKGTVFGNWCETNLEQLRNMDKNLENLKKNVDFIQSTVSTGETALVKMLLEMANAISNFPIVFETIVEKLQLKLLEQCGKIQKEAQEKNKKLREENKIEREMMEKKILIVETTTQRLLSEDIGRNQARYENFKVVESDIRKIKDYIEKSDKRHQEISSNLRDITWMIEEIGGFPHVGADKKGEGVEGDKSVEKPGDKYIKAGFDSSMLKIKQREGKTPKPFFDKEAQLREAEKMWKEELKGADELLRKHGVDTEKFKKISEEVFPKPPATTAGQQLKEYQKLPPAPPTLSSKSPKSISH